MRGEERTFLGETNKGECLGNDSSRDGQRRRRSTLLDDSRRVSANEQISFALLEGETNLEFFSQMTTTIGNQSIVFTGKISDTNRSTTNTIHPSILSLSDEIHLLRQLPTVVEYLDKVDRFVVDDVQHSHVHLLKNLIDLRGVSRQFSVVRRGTFASLSINNDQDQRDNEEKKNEDPDDRRKKNRRQTIQIRGRWKMHLTNARTDRWPTFALSLNEDPIEFADRKIVADVRIDEVSLFIRRTHLTDQHQLIETAHWPVKRRFDGLRDRFQPEIFHRFQS